MQHTGARLPTREKRPASSVSKVQILNLRQGYALPSDDRTECVRVSVCEDIRPTRTAVPRLGCCFSFPSKQPQIVEIEGDRASKPAPASQSDFRLQCSSQHQHQHQQQQQRQPLRLSRAPFYSRCCSLAACAARAEQQRARPPPQQQRPTGSELHLSNSIPVQDHHPPRFAAVSLPAPPAPPQLHIPIFISAPVYNYIRIHIFRSQHRRGTNIVPGSDHCQPVSTSCSCLRPVKSIHPEHRSFAWILLLPSVSSTALDTIPRATRPSIDFDTAASGIIFDCRATHLTTPTQLLL